MTMLEHIIPPPQYQRAIFSFEENFDHHPWISWFENNWTISLWASLVYVVVIFGLKHYMRDKPKLDLRLPLVVWSFCLAVFSVVCMVRLWQEYLLYMGEHGFRGTMCDSFSMYSGVNGFWSFIFVISKLPELGDTLFVVLRKQKLIFLHWYHHITVLVYSWYSYSQLVAPGRYFILMNATVHAIMYSYYALRASKLTRIPRPVNMAITFLQTSQMFVGVVINFLALYHRSQGVECSTTNDNIFWAFLMYASYFVLFAHYFYQAYFAPKPKPQKMDANANGVVHTNGMHQNGMQHNGVVSNGHSCSSLKKD